MDKATAFSGKGKQSSTQTRAGNKITLELGAVGRIKQGTWVRGWVQPEVSCEPDRGAARRSTPGRGNPESGSPKEREVGSVPQGRWEAKLGTGALRRSLDVPSLKRGRWRSTPGGTHWLVFVKDRLEVVPMQFSPLLCAGKVL